MKKFVGLLAFLVAFTCSLTFAAQNELTFVWDQDLTVPVVGWKLYQSETSGTYGTTPFQIITYNGTPAPSYQSTATVDIPAGVHKKFFWVVTAYNADAESGRSNEVSTDHYFPLGPPSVPVTFRATVRSIP